MDSRPNAGNKAAFLNFSGAVGRSLSFLQRSRHRSSCNGMSLTWRP